MSANLCFVNKHIIETKTFENGESVRFSPQIELNTELNVSNSNASTILAALGFNPNFECAPDIQVREFEAALNRFISSEISGLIDGGKSLTQSGNVIDCGRRAGYVGEKIQIMLKMTEAAILKGATHVYFS